jgi:molybdopterin-guanine dinucleotide biosynthesis protein A
MQRESENISGVILAGGENKRFDGIIKSNIMVGGSSIMSRMVSLISEIFEEIIIVTNTPDEFQAFKQFKIVSDQFLKVGPLGGIHAAIKNSSKDSVFIFAGDMPFIDKELIVNEVRYFNKDSTDAVIPELNNKFEPLHAIYNCSVFEKLDNYLSFHNKYAIRDFLEIINVRYMKLPDSEKIRRAFININTPGEAEKAKKHIIST